MTPAPDPLVQAFDRLVQRSPAATLIASVTRRCTVRDIDALARSASRQLESAGLEPGQVVALAAGNGPGFLAAFLSLRRAGLAALLMDRRTPRAEQQRIVRRFGCPIILASPLAWPDRPGGFVISRGCTQEETIAGPPGTAVVKLSSGSTGEPSGVAAHTESLMADDEALTATMEIKAADRLVAMVPFSHSYGLSSLVIPALIRGNLLVVPEDDGPLGPVVAAQALDATVMPTVPAYLSPLLRLLERPALPASLRLVISAGAPLLPDTARSFRQRFGLAVHVFYGASECGGISYDRSGEAAERGTVGTPVHGVRVRIDAPPEASPDGGGRIIVNSPAVALRYLPEPDGRLENGCFITDDLGSWREGELEIVGRVSEFINVKGKKVNPREVEQIIAELPQVNEVSVLEVPGPGENQPVVRAVVACENRSVTEEDVLIHCRSRLSRHKVPRSVVIVTRIPRTARGKVDRKALLER